jgi:hypothetical protein
MQPRVLAETQLSLRATATLRGSVGAWMRLVCGVRTSTMHRTGVLRQDIVHRNWEARSGARCKVRSARGAQLVIGPRHPVLAYLLSYDPAQLTHQASMSDQPLAGAVPQPADDYAHSEWSCILAAGSLQGMLRRTSANLASPRGWLEAPRPWSAPWIAAGLKPSAPRGVGGCEMLRRPPSDSMTGTVELF